MLIVSLEAALRPGDCGKVDSCPLERLRFSSLQAEESFKVDPSGSALVPNVVWPEWSSGGYERSSSYLPLNPRQYMGLIWKPDANLGKFQFLGEDGAMLACTLPFILPAKLPSWDMALRLGSAGSAKGSVRDEAPQAQVIPEIILSAFDEKTCELWQWTAALSAALTETSRR